MVCPHCGKAVGKSVDSTGLSTPGPRVYSDQDQRSDPDLSASSRAIPAGARSKPTARFQVLLELFGARWARSYGRQYPVTAADRNQLSRFMREHGEYLDSWADIVDRYMRDRQQFLIERSSGHTLRWLVTSGLAMYGGRPRESAEQYAARIRKEHDSRKQRNRVLRPQAPEMQQLIMGLAKGKAANY